MGSSNKANGPDPLAPEGQRDEMLINSVAKSLNILEALQTVECPTISNVADHLGLSNSSVYKHVATFEDQGYVVKEGETYRLSLRIFELGTRLNKEWFDVFEPARNALTELAIETGENCWLMFEEDGEGVMVRNVAGENSLEPGFCQEGKRMPLHPSAAGKAILAHLPEERRNRIIDDIQLEELTDRTITSRAQLREELATVRERGVAVNDEEAQPNIRAVGAPIVAADGTVLGSISVSGPTSRLSGDYYEEELPEMVREKANIVEINAVLNSDLISLYHGVEGRRRGNRFYPWKSISSTSLSSVGT